MGRHILKGVYLTSCLHNSNFATLKTNRKDGATVDVYGCVYLPDRPQVCQVIFISAWASALLILYWWAMRRPELWDKRQVQFPRFLYICLICSITHLFKNNSVAGTCRHQTLCKQSNDSPLHGHGLICGRLFCFPFFASQIILAATNCT